MTEHRSAERDLDLFWNDLVSGNPSQVDLRLDPGDVEMIRMLRSLGESPQTHASRERVRAAVDAEIERSERGMRSNGRVVGGTKPVAQVAPVRRGPVEGPPTDHRWLASWVSAAAVVLLTVAAIAIIGFALRSSWRSASDERTAVPAAIAPGTPVPTATTTAIPGVSQTELFELAIPAEVVPAGPASVALSHLTLPPDGIGTQASAFNVGLYYLVSGQLSVLVDGKAQVLRAGNAEWEPVEANTEATLGRGDAVLLVNLGDVTFSNPGSTPVEAIAFGLTSDVTGVQPLDAAGWTINDYALVGQTFPVPSPGVLLPGKPALVRLSLVVLEPRAVRPVAPSDRFELAVIVPDNGLGTPAVPNVAIAPDGRTRNLGVTSIAVYSVTLEVPGAAGTPLASDPNVACQFSVGTAFVTGACDEGAP